MRQIALFHREGFYVITFFLKALITTALMGGYGLSACKKLENLYEALRWSARNIKAVDHLMNL